MIGPDGILGRNLCDLDWPLDSEQRIIPSNAGFQSRGVEFTDLIGDLRIIGKRNISVGKSLWYEQGQVIPVREFDAEMFQIGFRIGPQIYDAIKNGSPGAAYQFRFSSRRELEMHAPEGTLMMVE